MLLFKGYTNPEVQQALTKAHEDKTKIRIFYGSTDTGQAWCESYGVLGYVKPSPGLESIPLIVRSKRDKGGPMIVMELLVGIFNTDTGQPMYVHKNFETGIFTYKEVDNMYVVRRQFSNETRGSMMEMFETSDKANKYCQFMMADLFVL
jgi:hypothetical protein